MTWNFLKKKVTVPGNPEEETITYRRKKAKGKWQAIFQQFKPEVIHHELMGKACTCPDCHGRLKEIGSCVQRQELVYVPAQLKRVDHIQHAYKWGVFGKKSSSRSLLPWSETVHKQIVNKEKNLQSRVTWEIFNIPRYWTLTLVVPQTDTQHFKQRTKMSYCFVVRKIFNHQKNNT